MTTTTKSTTKSTKTAKESNIEKLQEKLAALTLELGNTQTERDAALSRLAERELELENTRAALQEANRNRPVDRPHIEQEEVFAVLKFKNPQPLPAVDRTLNQFIADNPELDAVEVEELRFNHSPRGENVYLQLRHDRDAPIEFSRRNFALKNGKTEEEMIAHITQIFNTHIQA
ncbi:hypothetical protein BGX21_008292 [Mortierella sp. AD011]|nr:hypothetical protein BGX20_002995 [Mortierella sp. AD010]KAF9397986.1 hypothetical protein BGX21_008292 [Mortierella sp. AD011]